MDKKQKLQIEMPAVLYVKSILFTNGIYDLNIKDILSKAGFDTNKPSKLYFKNNKLIYQYEKKEYDIIFDYCRLMNTTKIVLTITFKSQHNEHLLQYVFLKGDKTKKTSLIKDMEENNKWVKLKRDNNSNELKMVDSDSREYDVGFYLQEIVNSGLTNLNSIKFIIENGINYSKYGVFKLYRYLRNNIYDIDSRSYLELQKYLVDLTIQSSIESISTQEIYAKICEIYSIEPDSIDESYEVDFVLADSNDDRFYFRYEDTHSQIKIIDKGEKKEYRRVRKLSS